MAFGSNENFGLFQVVSGPPSAGSTPLTDPSPGGRVDRVTGTVGQAQGGMEYYRGASAGVVAALQAGGSFSSGTELATNGSGQPVAASAGDRVVAIALESSSGVGDGVWVVCTGNGWTA